MQEIRPGQTMTIGGSSVTLVKIKKDGALLRDDRNGKTFTYGLAALRKTAGQFGYEIEGGTDDKE